MVFSCTGFQITDLELHDFCLLVIEMFFVSNGRSLKEFVSLPQLDMSNSSFFQNTFIVKELNYDKEDMAKQHASMLESLNTEQVEFMKRSCHQSFYKKEGSFFLYGHGGTGKTFMWRTCHVLLDIRE